MRHVAQTYEQHEGGCILYGERGGEGLREGGRKPSIFSRLYDRSRAVESVSQRRKVEDSFVNALWQIESMTAFAIQRDF